MRKIFWAANVRTKNFNERLEAATAGGFKEMSIFPIDVKNYVNGGLSLAQLKQQAADKGIRISVLDPFALWVPDTTPAPWASPADLEFTNFTEDDIFVMAEGLGIESINLIETFGNTVPTAEATERFAKLAKRCENNGYRLQVEFMPFSGINSLEKAWDIVKTADAPNGGLTFDTWHYYRGTVNDDLLRTIPGNKIFQVQYADAKSELQGDLVNDLLHHRLFPGEGNFPLRETVEILNQMGGNTAVGIELFSDKIDAMSPTEVGQKVADGLKQLLHS